MIIIAGSGEENTMGSSIMGVWKKQKRLHPGKRDKKPA
jgi:hypothetical protein